MSKYKWQGENVDVVFGYVKQIANIEKPMYWYNFECMNKENSYGDFVPDHMVTIKGENLALIPAINVVHDDGSFLLANHFGIGVNKLLKGGWPNMPHYSLDGEFNESKERYFKFLSFDEEKYSEYETKRKKWQKKTYPLEFQKMEDLKNAFLNSKK